MRRKISRIANRVRSEWLGDGVSDAGCALKVFRREVVGAFIPIRTLYSFMPSLAVAAGFRVVEVPVKHRARARGDSKYSVRSFLVLPIVDCIGLRWFRSRRCQPRPSRPSQEDRGTLAEELSLKAVDDEVISARTKSAAGNSLELSGNEHHYNPKHLLPR